MSKSAGKALKDTSVSSGGKTRKLASGTISHKELSGPVHFKSDWYNPPAPVKSRKPASRGIVIHGEVDRETDGRWIVDITDLPGVLAYGATQSEAKQRAIALALRVLADRIDDGEFSAPAGGFSFELNPQP